MSENSCDRCGGVTSKLCSDCTTTEQAAAASNADREMRSFTDEIRSATDVNDLVGPSDPAD